MILIMLGNRIYVYTCMPAFPILQICNYFPNLNVKHVGLLFNMCIWLLPTFQNVSHFQTTSTIG